MTPETENNIVTDEESTNEQSGWNALFGCIMFLALLVGIGFVVWFVGSWIWDFVGGLFEGGGGDGGRLARYCAGKWGSSPLYRECIADGWKSWYATAHWMQ